MRVFIKHTSYISLALYLTFCKQFALLFILFQWSRDSEENNKSNGGEDDMKLSEEEKNELENNAK